MCNERSKSEGSEVVRSESASDSGELTDAVPTGNPVLDNIFDIEKRRVDRDNRRTAVAAQSLQVANEQDRRHFEYASKVHEDGIELARKQSTFANRIIVGLLGFGFLVVVVILVVLILGTEAQAQMMMKLLGYVAVAIAGHGIMRVLKSVLRNGFSE